ncbi:MAG: phosphate ABC transporter permease, partial [Fusobacterium sp.]
MRIRKKDIIIKLWTYISGIITVSLIVFLFGYIFLKGYKVISWEFITDVPKGMILGTEGGIAPALIGSFLSAGIAVI